MHTPVCLCLKCVLPSHLQSLSEEERPLKMKDPLTLKLVVCCEEMGFNLPAFLTVKQPEKKGY